MNDGYECKRLTDDTTFRTPLMIYIDFKNTYQWQGKRKGFELLKCSYKILNKTFLVRLRGGSARGRAHGFTGVLMLCTHIGRAQLVALCTLMKFLMTLGKLLPTALVREIGFLQIEKAILSW